VRWAWAQAGPYSFGAPAIVDEGVKIVRVLARPAFRNRLQNPYNALIYTAMLEQGAQVSEYYGGGWLFGQHDVFHIHWPESAFNHGLVGAWLTSRVLLTAMDRLRRQGTRCIWTAHNLAAHERRFPKAEARAWRAFNARLDGFISLTSHGLVAVRERFPELRDVPGFAVAHPHFRGAYPDTLTREQARARLGIAADTRVISYLGRILEYKNVPELVRVFLRSVAAPGASDTRPWQLLVAGQPRSQAQVEQVTQACSGDARVHLWLRHIASDELQLFLRAADLVVLPYREIFNSGSALLALSFDRPVLMPSSPTSLDLRESCGADWVHVYDSLTPDVLRATLEAAERLPERDGVPGLRARDPQLIAAQTLAAYRAVIEQAARAR
jgi:glycosyltransferase involved in cell wall biosynthesis